MRPVLITFKKLSKYKKLSGGASRLLYKGQWPGMDAETLNNLTGYLEGLNNNFKSNGLKNVHKRIQLYYGSDYGIKIESIRGSGTSAHVMLPRMLA